MICLSCGARNSESAQWCQRCHAPFRAPESRADPGPLPMRAGAPSSAAAQDAWDALSRISVVPGRGGVGLQVQTDSLPAAGRVEPGPPVVEADGAGERTGRRIGAPEACRGAGRPGGGCRVWGGAQAIADTTCRACGASLFSEIRTRPTVRAGNPRVALLASVVPGGGQWYLHQRAQAAGRAVLVVLSLVAAAGFPGSGAVGLMRYLLAAVGCAVWVLSGIDASRVAPGRPDAALLKERALFWVACSVVVVLVASALMALLVGLAAPRG